MIPVKYDKSICARMLLSSEIILADIGGQIRDAYIRLVRSQHIQEVIHYCLYASESKIRFKSKNTQYMQSCILLNTHDYLYNQCAHEHNKCVDDRYVEIFLSQSGGEITATIELSGCREQNEPNFNFEYKQMFESLVAMADYCKFYKHVYGKYGYEHEEELFFNCMK